MRIGNGSHFTLRTPCAPNSCRVLSAHAMRAEILPGFARACHARRILAGFCLRMSCAPNSCRVLPAHAMRAEFLPGFVCACHARRNLAGFCSAHAVRAEILAGFALRMPCEPKSWRLLAQKEFWRPKLKSDRSTRPTWPAPLGALIFFCLFSSIKGRKEGS